MGGGLGLGPPALPAWAEEVECVEGARVETGEKHRAHARSVWLVGKWGAEGSMPIRLETCGY